MESVRARVFGRARACRSKGRYLKVVLKYVFEAKVEVSFEVEHLMFKFEICADVLIEALVGVFSELFIEVLFEVRRRREGRKVTVKAEFYLFEYETEAKNQSVGRATNFT